MDDVTKIEQYAFLKVPTDEVKGVQFFRIPCIGFNRVKNNLILGKGYFGTNWFHTSLVDSRPVVIADIRMDTDHYAYKFMKELYENDIFGSYAKTELISHSLENELWSKRKVELMVKDVTEHNNIGNVKVAFNLMSSPIKGNITVDGDIGYFKEV